MRDEFEYLCPDCFDDKGTLWICPHCDYDEKQERSHVLLPYRTRLNNKYVVGHLLGKVGGFGITYLAWDINLRQRVAIKEYFPSQFSSRQTNQHTVIPHSQEAGEMFSYGLKQFLHEARTLEKFNHPNIVKVIEFFEQNHTAYIVMDYHQGRPLSEYVEQQGGKISDQLATEILIPVLDGLREIHRQNVFHRDISPQNIYLTYDNHVILLDFGAAHEKLAGRSQSLSVILKPGFAPFEQYVSKGNQGPWTDIYACAATLYFMVTGKVPVASVDRIAGDTLVPPALVLSNISLEFDAVVMKGLALKVEDRPQTAEAFQEMLIAATTKTLSTQATKKNAEPKRAAPDEPAKTVPDDKVSTDSPTGVANKTPGNHQVYSGPIKLSRGDSAKEKEAIPLWVWGLVSAAIIAVILVIGFSNC